MSCLESTEISGTQVWIKKFLRMKNKSWNAAAGQRNSRAIHTNLALKCKRNAVEEAKKCKAHFVVRERSVRI